MSIKYITKPVIVEAVQWDGHNEEAIKTLLGDAVGIDMIPVGCYIVKTGDGSLQAYTEKDFHDRFQRHLVWEDNI